MKRASFLLSLAVLAHLSVVDMVYYFLGSSISVNFIAILTYNIVWVVVAMMVGNQVFNQPRS
ncbi:hypothetical protein FHG64_00510 [Antarcticibacterium flavum]|jgi:hypothetical protein|uniref:Uncharacterized protein n=1 Tax=Antarcticibacterium flavum TaxID=2058175 RepID=A0A5B7WY66_9FLAO|nr:MULTISPECIES: hypothetical protein [Antarcticibacterium]MCM4160829.1 hypothetical protein [Antarcticibacterium sp. W02-3]QCY67997.1 hypothetical protein FHG64_00510 [Antarcticibacterium flavum]